MTTKEIFQLELFKINNIKVLSNGVKFNFVDLFAGIGGFRIPLEKLGGRCLGYSEIDKESIKVYQSNFLQNINHNEIELGDITKIESLPANTDLIVGGVPCQPWSVAGKSKGFEDPRGQLWFDVIKLVEKEKPKAFIFENVRGISSPKHRESLEHIVEKLEASNYCVKWQIINSYDFGIPQSRERVFIVGIRRDIDNHEQYRFPEPLKYKPKLIDVIDSIKGCKLIEKVKINPEILFGDTIPYSRNRFQKDDELNDFFVFSDLRNGHTTIHSWDLKRTSVREKEICIALLRNRRRKKYGLKDGNPLSFNTFSEIIPGIKEKELTKLVKKKILKALEISTELKYDFVNSKNSSGINDIYRIFLPSSEMIPTLTATGAKDFIATETIYADNPEEYKILFLQNIYKRKRFKPVTANDACKLQGFPDWFKIHKSETTAKKQFGNAVSVPAVYHIAKNLIEIIEN